MRKVLLLAAMAAALALPASATADVYLNGALIKRFGVACSSCQLIVQMPQGSPYIFNAGAVVTYNNNEAWNVPLQTIVMSETLNVQGWTNSAGFGPWNCRGGEGGDTHCRVTVWARSGCPGGYQYSPSKTGVAYTAYPNYWGTLTINTTGCHPIGAPAS
jgi:hypothetical protein